VILDTITRLIPGAVGNEASTRQESFTASDVTLAPAKGACSTCDSGGLLDYPHYTRPADFRGMAVPEVLMNGNHDDIRRWRRRAGRDGNQFDSQKLVRVQFRFDAARFEVQINDQGGGFDYEHLPDPCDPANLLKSSGRGIFLVRSFMDDFSLIYVPNQGTEVKFAKKLARS
jgi:hypothetical protein